MEFPVFPQDLKDVVEHLDTSGKELSWTLQRTSKKLVLNLIWKSVGKSNFPSKKITQRKCPSTEASRSRNAAGNIEKSAIPSVSSAGAQDLPEAEKPMVVPSHSFNLRRKSHPKKKKSPSRLKRDRKRLLEFRKKKATEKKHSEFSYNHLNEDPLPKMPDVVVVQPGNILYRDLDPETVASATQPMTISVHEKARILDIKRTITCVMDIHKLPLFNPSSIVLNLLDTKHASSLPVISDVPDDLLLQQILVKHSLEECHMQYDICFDEKHV